MIYSGLDWSGDAGDPAKQGASRDLVFAVAHLDERNTVRLDDALAELRKARGLPPDYAFKYRRLKGRPELCDAFFAALPHRDLTATVWTVNKGLWLPTYLRSTEGRDRINGCIADIICECAADLVCGNALFIDGEKDESPTLEMARRAIRLTMEARDLKSFSKVRMIDDESPEGSIIQVADMIAGSVRHRGINGAQLKTIRARIRMV